MTSTWWRMSRWAVGSSRTRIGAVWATATARNTSWRSPIDSSRASRPAQVADTDPLDRARRRPPRSDGREPAERRLVRQAPSADDLVDAHRERQLGELGHDGDRAGDGLRGPAPPIGAPPSATAPGVGARTPVSARSSVDLPAPFGPDQRDPLAAREREVDVARRSRRVADSHRDAARRQDRWSAVTARTPVRVRCSRNRKNGAPRRAITTPTGMSPSQPGDEVGGGQQRRAEERRERDDAGALGPDQQPDDVRHDEPDEADQPADRDGRRGGQRRQRRAGSPRSRRTSMPRWRAAASPSSSPSSDRARASDQRRTPRG